MPKPNEFDETFEALKKILKPLERRLKVQADAPGNYCLTTRHIMRNKQPLWFAGVRKNKSYVSYHLVPVYACPELIEGMSAELKKRMQGKGCFNFKTVDPKLFKELAKLTKVGLQRISDEEVLQKFNAR